MPVPDLEPAEKMYRCPPGLKKTFDRRHLGHVNSDPR